MNSKDALLGIHVPLKQQKVFISNKRAKPKLKRSESGKKLTHVLCCILYYRRIFFHSHARPCPCPLCLPWSSFMFPLVFLRVSLVFWSVSVLLSLCSPYPLSICVHLCDGSVLSLSPLAPFSSMVCPSTPYPCPVINTHSPSHPPGRQCSASVTKV